MAGPDVVYLMLFSMKDCLYIEAGLGRSWSSQLNVIFNERLSLYWSRALAGPNIVNLMLFSMEDCLYIEAGPWQVLM